MPSITPFEGKSFCLGVGFIADRPTFFMADGLVHSLGETPVTVEVHDGMASLALAPDAKSAVTGGEDGRVCRLNANGKVDELMVTTHKWITSVACGPQNSVAFASQRNVWTITGEGATREQSFNHSIEALAFAPKGQRLAMAHYNGVTLAWLGVQTPGTLQEWKGVHNKVTFSPDNRFLVTAMQENALHGWRLADNQHLRMTGYPTKVKNWSWSVRGKWLATSGAMAAIVWPFSGKDGPMGKAPLELGTRASNLVTAVACHPQEEAVAIGFDDGMILFVRFADAKELLFRRSGRGPISALRWDDRGFRLVFGSQSGDCGVVDITN